MAFCFFFFLSVLTVVAVLGNMKPPASYVSHELSGSSNNESIAFTDTRSQNLPAIHGGVLICINIGVRV